MRPRAILGCLERNTAKAARTIKETRLLTCSKASAALKSAMSLVRYHRDAIGFCGTLGECNVWASTGRAVQVSPRTGTRPFGQT